MAQKIIECYKIPNEEEMESLKEVIADSGGPPPVIIRDAGKTQIARGSKTVLAFFAPINKSLL